MLYTQKSLWLLLWLTAMFFFSCKDDSNNQPQSTVCQNPVQLDSFPLGVGNNWRYLRQISVTDSNGILTDTSTTIINRTVVSDTIINGQTSYRIFQIDSNLTTGVVSIGARYCYNSIDGFYLNAMDGLASSLDFLIYDQSIQDIYHPESLLLKVDSTIIILEPYQYLQFPSQIGNQWIPWYSFNAPSSRIERRYDSCQHVSTSAGSFDCLKVSNKFYDNGVWNSIQHHFYYSTKGLIMEQRSHPYWAPVGAYYMQTTLIGINF